MLTNVNALNLKTNLNIDSYYLKYFFKSILEDIFDVFTQMQKIINRISESFIIYFICNILTLIEFLLYF